MLKKHGEMLHPCLPHFMMRNQSDIPLSTPDICVLLFIQVLQVESNEIGNLFKFVIWLYQVAYDS